MSGSDMRSRTAVRKFPHNLTNWDCTGYLNHFSVILIINFTFSNINLLSNILWHYFFTKLHMFLPKEVVVMFFSPRKKKWNADLTRILGYYHIKLQRGSTRFHIKWLPFTMTRMILLYFSWKWPHLQKKTLTLWLKTLQIKLCSFANFRGQNPYSCVQWNSWSENYRA